MDEFKQSLLKFRKEIIESLRGIKYTEQIKGISHTQVIPTASYSPWLDDPGFLETYGLVHSHTLVDIYRCWELWNLVGQIKQLDGDLLEVGVWRGGTAAIMGAANLFGTGNLILADTFKGVPKAGEKDTSYKGGEHADTTEETVRQVMKKLNIVRYELLSGVFPDSFSSDLLPQKLKLCHIDVDTFESARDVLNWVWPRLLQGGVVVFDDYGFWGCEGITILCNELVYADCLKVHNLNGHFLLIKSGF